MRVFVHRSRYENQARGRKPMDPKERRILIVILSVVVIGVCALFLARIRLYLPPYSELDNYNIYEGVRNASGGITETRREMAEADYEQLRQLVEDSRFHYSPFLPSPPSVFHRMWTIMGTPWRSVPTRVVIIEYPNETRLYIQYGEGFRATTYVTAIDPNRINFLDGQGANRGRIPVTL